MKRAVIFLSFLTTVIAASLLSGWDGGKMSGAVVEKKGKVIKANTTIPYRDDADYSEHDNDMYLWEE